jgi:hypothetical protein
VGLAIGLVALDGTLPVTHGAAVFPGPPQGPRSFLSGIIQAMISFTGLVFDHDRRPAAVERPVLPAGAADVPR